MEYSDTVILTKDGMFSANGTLLAKRAPDSDARQAAQSKLREWFSSKVDGEIIKSLAQDK